MTKDEAALEAQLVGELVSQVGGERNEGKVTLHELDRAPRTLCDVLQVELVVDEPARESHPVIRWASRSAGSIFT